jgi:hypothetical protein
MIDEEFPEELTEEFIEPEAEEEQPKSDNPFEYRKMDLDEPYSTTYGYVPDGSQYGQDGCRFYGNYMICRDPRGWYYDREGKLMRKESGLEQV